MNDSGALLVDHPLNHSGRPLAARSTVSVDPDQAGRDVVLALERGDVRKPIILGVLRRSGETPAEKPAPRSHTNPAPVTVERDGERLVLAAEKEIVMRCGQASITLTRAGKVLIRGAFLLSRSSGVNRIKGGSVQIN
jgi:hypothetical protein